MPFSVIIGSDINAIFHRSDLCVSEVFFLWGIRSALVLYKFPLLSSQLFAIIDINIL